MSGNHVILFGELKTWLAVCGLSGGQTGMQTVPPVVVGSIKHWRFWYFTYGQAVARTRSCLLFGGLSDKIVGVLVSEIYPILQGAGLLLPVLISLALSITVTGLFPTVRFNVVFVA